MCRGRFGACVIRRRPEINPSFGLRPIRPPVARHPHKAKRDPNTVLLTVLIDWSAPKLWHYMSWFDPGKKKLWLHCQNNPAAWFVYFATISPKQIFWR